LGFVWQNGGAIKGWTSQTVMEEIDSEGIFISNLGSSMLLVPPPPPKYEKIYSVGPLIKWKVPPLN